MQKTWFVKGKTFPMSISPPKSIVFWWYHWGINSRQEQGLIPCENWSHILKDDHFLQRNQILRLFAKILLFFSCPARASQTVCVGASIISLRANDVSKTMEPETHSFFHSLLLTHSHVHADCHYPPLRVGMRRVSVWCHRSLNLISRWKFKKKKQNSHPREKTPFDFAGERSHGRNLFWRPPAWNLGRFLYTLCCSFSAALSR